MIVCDPCPYRGRCENMARCIQGKNPPVEVVATPRPPKTVATTFGHTETASKIGSTIKSKKPVKAAKKKVRKVTMQ